MLALSKCANKKVFLVLRSRERKQADFFKKTADSLDLPAAKRSKQRTGVRHQKVNLGERGSESTYIASLNPSRAALTCCEAEPRVVFAPENVPGGHADGILGFLRHQWACRNCNAG